MILPLLYFSVVKLFSGLLLPLYHYNQTRLFWVIRNIPLQISKVFAPELLVDSSLNWRVAKKKEKKKNPQHDSATLELLSWDGVSRVAFRVIRSTRLQILSFLPESMSANCYLALDVVFGVSKSCPSLSVS